MEQIGKPAEQVTPVEISHTAQLVRAYRFFRRNHSTKLGCARETGLCRQTVAKWWNRCELSEEDIEDIKAVRQWIAGHNGSKDYLACSADLGREPAKVKADMRMLHEWNNGRM